MRTGLASVKEVRKSTRSSVSSDTSEQAADAAYAVSGQQKTPVAWRLFVARLSSGKRSSPKPEAFIVWKAKFNKD